MVCNTVSHSLYSVCNPYEAKWAEDSNIALMKIHTEIKDRSGLSVANRCCHMEDRNCESKQIEDSTLGATLENALVHDEEQFCWGTIRYFKIFHTFHVVSIMLG